MSGQAHQLVLDLSHRPALGLEDFIVSGSNEQAVAMIDAWPNWPGLGIVLTGPSGSGKTHLGNVFRLITSTGAIEAAGLSEPGVLRLAQSGGALVENVEQGFADEKAMFHLLNLARELNFKLILTSKALPGDWNITLPDLRSRLRTLPVVHIGQPDEALLSAVIVKLLADRQLPASPAAVQHLSRNLERSLQHAERVVAELDRMVWQEPRQISRDMAKRALQAIGGPAADDGGAA